MKSVLSIAGSDSSGGAGIQADIKTIEAHGLYAQTAITALTAQNTLGVYAVHNLPASFVKRQVDAVFADICPQAIKIGMLSTPEIVCAVAQALRQAAENITPRLVDESKPVAAEPKVVSAESKAVIDGPKTVSAMSKLVADKQKHDADKSEPITAESKINQEASSGASSRHTQNDIKLLASHAQVAASGKVTHSSALQVVLDPVLVATSGAKLSGEDTVQAMRTHLFPLATLITPNIPEAELLWGKAITNSELQAQAACAIAASAQTAVLVKGGHGIHDANDVLASPDGSVRWFKASRIENSNTHGTGCTLSSAIACGLAHDLPLEEAILNAKAYLMGALNAKLNLGKGSGPLAHFWKNRSSL